MPVAVVIIAKFVLHEPVRNRQFVAVGVAVLGVLIVVFGAGAASGATLYGDALAFVNVAVWTAFFMRMKNLRDDGAALVVVAGSGHDGRRHRRRPAVPLGRRRPRWDDCVELVVPVRHGAAARRASGTG